MKLKRVEKIDLYYWIFIGVVFILFACIGIRSCSYGTKPDHYRTICIEGHAYQMVNFGAKMALASKLDEEGRPVNCQ